MVASLLPLVFASVVLWRYDPMLVVVLVSLIVVTGLLIAPLVRRRQRLVDQREAAIARVSGHVADSLMNMDTVRAFAAEDREAAEHRVARRRAARLAIRSWDYAQPAHRHGRRADVRAHQHARAAARGRPRRRRGSASRRSW